MRRQDDWEKVLAKQSTGKMEMRVEELENRPGGADMERERKEVQQWRVQSRGIWMEWHTARVRSWRIGNATQYRSLELSTAIRSSKMAWWVSRKRIQLISLE